jgi:hypothetical protein
MFAVTLSCLLVFLPVLPASAQATPQRAGDVEAYIPVGKIARTMGEAPSPAVGVDIFWEDRVETEPTGRIRIQLDDGSTLNVGSESQLTVLKHDRVSRQTNLSLAMGKMRCVVKDLKSAKDGKFEVKTNTAVLGVIGTDFFVEATATETRVIVYEGAVRVVNINSSILGTQVIREGQRAVVRTERPPLAPNRATRAELEESVQETRVGEELPQPSSERAEEPSREKKRGLNRWVVVAIAAAVAAAAIAIPVAVSGGKTAPPLPNAPPPGPPPPPPPVD